MILLYTLIGLAAAFAVVIIYIGIRLVVDPDYYERSQKEVARREEEKRRRRAPKSVFFTARHTRPYS